MSHARKIATIGAMAMLAATSSSTALTAQQGAAWANIVAGDLPIFGANGAKAFDQYLRDYPHTRFSHLRGTAFITSSPMTYVFEICGDYNAPNAFGGFDGWKPFLLKSPMNGETEAVRFKNVDAPVLETEDMGYYLIDTDCGVAAPWLPMEALNRLAKPN